MTVPLPRIVVTGTLPTVCHAKGMTRFLYAAGVRIFDHGEFAAELRDRVRAGAARLAAAAGIEVEHIARSHIRKEAVVAKVPERRGNHPGLVHVISAMEACSAYKPWQGPTTGSWLPRPISCRAATMAPTPNEPSATTCRMPLSSIRRAISTLPATSSPNALQMTRSPASSKSRSGDPPLSRAGSRMWN